MPLFMSSPGKAAVCCAACLHDAAGTGSKQICLWAAAGRGTGVGVRLAAAAAAEKTPFDRPFLFGPYLLQLAVPELCHLPGPAAVCLHRGAGAGGGCLGNDGGEMAAAGLGRILAPYWQDFPLFCPACGKISEFFSIFFQKAIGNPKKMGYNKRDYPQKRKKYRRCAPWYAAKKENIVSCCAEAIQ